MMHDVTQYVGASADIEQHLQHYGEDPQWTGNSFSGMPSYMIDFKIPAWIIRHIFKSPVRIFGEPAILIFTAMLFMWLMMLLWGVNPWVSIVPAIAYGFSTYTILIIGAGHISKVWAMAYVPLLLGAVMYTYRGRYLWFGAALAALAASLEISANHPQITYYFLLVIIALVVNELVTALCSHHTVRFAKATCALAVAAVLAVGSNFAPLYYTAQHTSDTTRGGSELAQAEQSAHNGLDLEYATAWSYGRSESLNMLVPNLYGGSSANPFSNHGPVADALAQFGASPSDLPLGTYWGDQPGTAGPTYIGAVTIFLAVLGFCLLEGRKKWWMLVIGVFALFLAWGHNMMWFTELCFKILPGYNKFRAVSTALVILQLILPLLAGLSLMELWRGDIPQQRLEKSLRWALLLTGGTVILIILGSYAGLLTSSTGNDYPMLYQIASMSGFNDIAARQFAESICNAMQTERLTLLRTDAWRSLLFIAISAALVWMFARGRMKRGIMLICFAGLMCLDMLPVDARYLSYKSFVPERHTRIYPTEADKEILLDKEVGFRVANFTVSTFNDATTSMFHRSIGGYHGAKLQRYQDLIDRHLAPGNLEVYNMLNTKYFIVPDNSTGRYVAQLNPAANGAAWFVEGVVATDSPNDEIAVLDTLNTKRYAVVDRKFATQLPVDRNSFIQAYENGSIQLADYKVNHLTYDYDSPAEALAVFSEIYYDKGWRAMVDGVETPYLRADYVLRAMVLPAGHHRVEFVFRAPGFRQVSAVTLICSIIILLAFAAATTLFIIKVRRDRTTGTTEHLSQTNNETK